MGLVTAQRANTGLIEPIIGTAYDVVKEVANNLDFLRESTIDNRTYAATATIKAEEAAVSAAAAVSSRRHND